MIEKQNRHTHITLGAALLITAFLIGTIQNALIKGKTFSGISTVEIVFFQYAICLLGFLPFIIKSRFQVMKTKKIGLLTTRALAGLAYFFGMFYAVKFITLVDVSLLTNSAPIWVPLICLVWLKMKISWKHYLGITMGFIGVALVLAPDNQVFSMHSFIALAAGLAMAISIVSVRRLTETESSQSILVYYFLIAAIAMLPLAIIFWKTPTLLQWGFLILNAVLMLIQQDLLNRGFNLGPAHRLSVTTYSGVIFAALLGWVFWDEALSFLTVIGAVLICFGGYKTITTKDQAPDEKNVTNSLPPQQIVQSDHD